MPIRLLWDGAPDVDTVALDVSSKCITAPTPAFAYVAGLLLDYANRFPSSGLEDDVDRKLFGVHQDRKAYIVAIATQLFKQAGCGDDAEMNFRLRANPADKCLIEQSVDGGDTWFTAYRLDDCLTTTDQITNNTYIKNILNEYNELITNLTNTYAGDVTNIYPDAPYDGGGTPEDDYRDIALCYAVSRAVTIVCDGILLAFDQRERETAIGVLFVGAMVGLFVLGTIASGGTLAVAAAAVAGSGGTAVILTTIGAGTAFTSWINVVLANQARAPFEDLAAREDVKCVLYNALKGQTLSAALFADALNTHGLTGNAGIIADAMDGANEVVENFVSFANLARQSFAATQVGIISGADCPCFEERTPVIDTAGSCAGGGYGGVDITDDGGGFWIIQASLATAASDYRVVIKDQLDRDFVITDVTYPATGATCIAYDEVGVGCGVDCTAPVFPAVAVSQAMWTWNDEWTVRFKMSAP